MSADELHKLSEHILELVDRSSSRVARLAGVSSCGLCKEVEIFFFQLLKLGRDTYIDGQLRQVLGELYEPIMDLRKDEQRNRLQARLPFNVSVK